MKKAAFALVALAAINLAACNTVNGAGKDIRSAGTAISDVSGKSGKSN